MLFELVNVSALRLILQQPSPVWKEFRIEDLKVFRSSEVGPYLALCILVTRMDTLVNSEASDEMLHCVAFHQETTETIFRERNTIFICNIICDPSLNTMNHPKCIVSNQKEEPTSA